MTICIYKDGVLGADRMVTQGSQSFLMSYPKIGMIYKGIENGERVLTCNPESIANPQEFAMFALAGELRLYSKFLRWFTSYTISGYDSEDYLVGLEDYPESKDSFSAIVVFKEKPICRVYDADYLRDLFIDYNRDANDCVICIGSGSSIAEGIFSYDPSASINKVIEAVTYVDNSCGRGLETLTFSNINIKTE